MPPKCKDPDVFTVPCKLGNLYVPRAMLDLGAFVNVLPYSLFKSIGVGTLSKTGVIIQLADRSLVHPKEVLEDVSSSILLGRPFLKTSKTKIDVYNGTLSMEFDGEVINFNVHEAKKTPFDVQSVNFVNLIHPSTKKGLNLYNNEFLELVLSRKLDRDKAKELAKKFDMDNEVLEILEFIDDKKHVKSNDIKPKPSTKVKILPPVEQAQDSEKKNSTGSLKEYTCLEGDGEEVDVLERSTYQD
uniref:Aspartic peptidase DDI1-type domain-containing protein n=1 Tax=Lactuca sativa TaxID=4236 RepID=A0A9R1VA35_LACSA|nr:hypothetical protein LSAT_V11C600300560 [Lactuca sativa]